MGNYKNKKEFDLRLEHFSNLITKMSISQACKLSNICRKTAKKYLEKNLNKKLLYKYRYLKINDEYFDLINTELKSYLLGFFLADGSITIKNPNSNYRLSLHNSIDDLGIIEIFKKEICLESKIGYRKNESKKDTCNISWTSKHMGELLISKYNIKLNKTFDLNFVFNFSLILDILQHHFIRGFFDGDGSISSSGQFSFVSTSLLFMKQLSELFCNKFETKCNMREKKGKNLIEYMPFFNSKVRYSSKKIFMKKIYDWLYKDSSIYLKRKKEKFEKYLNIVLIN